MTAENGIHSFKILGLEQFLAIGTWWAPRGDEEILNFDIELVRNKLSNFSHPLDVV